MKAAGLPDEMIVGEVIESDPPRKLVQTWHPLFTPDTAAEPHTRLTYEIQESQGGVCTVTLTHDVTGAPLVAGMVPGGGDPARAAAAGRGCSAISSRCWKPASACRGDPGGQRHVWRNLPPHMALPLKRERPHRAWLMQMRGLRAKAEVPGQSKISVQYHGPATSWP